MNVREETDIFASFLGYDSKPNQRAKLEVALKEHGGILGVLKLDEEDFCRIEGFGPSLYKKVQAALRLGPLVLERKLADKPIFSDRNVIEDYLGMHMAALPYEVFSVCFLDKRERLLSHEILFKGTQDKVHIHPRIVVERAIALKASAVLFCHNHPSDIEVPSQADLAVNDLLVQILSIVDVDVLDHFIYCKGKLCAFIPGGSSKD